jgi:exopolysaccharide biosynthesis polyprenyl glycosylphosphotransferase
MPQLAFERACTDLEQETETSPAPILALVETEAAPDLLNDVERTAAFLMFGVREAEIETESTDFTNPWSPEALARAFAYPETPAAEAPAIRPGFPQLNRRGVHIESGLAIRFIQAIDWVMVLVIAEFAARWGAGVGLMSLGIGDAMSFIAAALGLKIGLWLTEVYRTTPARMRPERALGGLALGAILGLGLANFFAPDARGAGALAAIIPAAAVLLAGIHAALAVWMRALHAKGVFSETVVLIGATDAARRLAQRANETGDARIILVADDRLSRAPTALGDAPVSGSVEDLLAWEGLPHVDRIVIAVSPKAENRVRDLIKRLSGAPNRVDLLLDFDTESVRGRRVDRLAAMGFACVSGRPRNWRRAFVKRAQDVILGAGLALVFALPMLVIAAAVRLDSKGPALYRQRRHGFNNRVITILKFRSMRHDPGAPLTQVSKDDPRVTRIGRFLRRTSLDELPQLMNVLRGEMSLVGPRPHAIGMRAAERDLTDIVADYAHRHRVKPGITGWAQVQGSRGALETPAQVRQRVRFDLDYVARASLWLDLQILVRTLPVLLGDKKATR